MQTGPDPAASACRISSVVCGVRRRLTQIGLRSVTSLTRTPEDAAHNRQGDSALTAMQVMPASSSLRRVNFTVPHASPEAALFLRHPIAQPPTTTTAAPDFAGAAAPAGRPAEN